MTDGDGLLRAILEAPDDDAPRLVFADWLEENGWEWEATQLRNAIAIPVGQWHPLQLALLHGHYPPAVMPAWVLHYSGDRGEFCRGFVSAIEVHPESFLAIASDLFAFQPIAAVHFVGARPKHDFWAWTWEWEPPDPRQRWDSPVLPKPIYDNLDQTTGTRWPTEEAAELALSLACIRYGRRLAGLSPPVWEPVTDDRA